MKRYILIILQIIAFYSMSHGILGLEKIKPLIGDVSAVKVDVAKNADAIVKADVQIGQNAKSLADVNARIGNIETKLNMQGNAIAGFNNKVSNISSGRDTTQTTTNSDSVVIQMLNTYKAIICLLVLQLVGLVIQMIVLIKYQAKLFKDIISEKEKMIERERASRDAKDQKGDEWMQKYIEAVSGKKTNGLVNPI